MEIEYRDLNVITLGETGVGKTSIINRLKDDSFNENESSTDAMKSFTIQKQFKKLNLTINLNFRDTAGQEKLIDSLPKQYIRDSHIVLLVFSDVETLNVIKERWYKHYKENTNIDNARFILVGNKSDIFGEMREEIVKQGEKFSEEIDALFVTCSAKIKDNLDNVERYITTEAKRYIENEEKEKEKNKKKEQKEPEQELNSCKSFKIKDNKKKKQKKETKEKHCCGGD